MNLGPRVAQDVEYQLVLVNLDLTNETRYVSKERRGTDPDGPLFVNPDGRGEGWWPETGPRRTWGKACEAAGVGRLSLRGDEAQQCDLPEEPRRRRPAPWRRSSGQGYRP